MSSLVALPQETSPRIPSSTLLQLQLRRRERRSRNFLLNINPKEEGEHPEQKETFNSNVEEKVEKSPQEHRANLEAWLKHYASLDSRDISCSVGNASSGSTHSCMIMPSLVSKFAPSLEPYPSLEKMEFTYKGGKDKEKRFFGRGEVEFPNGCYISGEWKNGEREGHFRMDSVGEISFLDANYIKGKINGKVRVQLKSGVWISGYAKDNTLHGFCRYYDSEKRLSFIGMHRNGIPFGTCWKLMQGGGYVVGRVDEEGKLSGPNIAYVYPDHRNALLGWFEDAQLVKAQAVVLMRLEAEYGCIQVPHFSPPEGEFFIKEISTTDWVTERPFLEDPYEKESVLVKHSNTPGADDGLFSARDLEKGSVAAFYNGIRKVKPANATTTWQLQDNAYKIFDPTNKKGVIDIIPKYQSMENYRASLAHKTNHSFNPNCEFSEIFHPRWGLVPCLLTNQNVVRGTELTVTYGYDMDWCPDWYRDAWEKDFSTPGETDTLKSG